MDRIEFSQRLLDRLLKEDRLLLTTHMQADPDGIGAELALDYLLRYYDKETLIINYEPLSPRFQFLDTENRIHSCLELDALDFENRIIVYLDNSMPQRSGFPERYLKSNLSNLIVVDHHDGAEPDHRIYFQDSKASSTAEMIYELFDITKTPLPQHIASALYAGIVMDTGHFRYGKTSPRTHEIAAELLRRKVRPEIMAERLISAYSTDRLLIKKALYKNLQINENRNLAWFPVGYSEKETLNFDWRAMEGLGNELIEPEEIKVGIVMVEKEPSVTHVSVRSRHEVDMLPAVQKFGGGGHKNACGARINLDIENAVKEFIPLAEQCIK